MMPITLWNKHKNAVVLKLQQNLELGFEGCRYIHESSTQLFPDDDPKTKRKGRECPGFRSLVNQHNDTGTAGTMNFSHCKL